MERKLIAVLICGIMTFSLVSCNTKTEKTDEPIAKARVEDRIVEGTWAKDYSKDEIMSFHNTIIGKVEELTKIYELKYEKKEIVKDDKGETINSNEIYLENLNPEPNRLESMDYSFKIYGSDLAQGQIILKIGFNLDSNSIKELGSFNFAETSIAEYSEAVTGVTNRDYTNLNNSLFEIINGNSDENIVENNLDGMIETINIQDNYLSYKLETKIYDFKK
ncbi:MAG: hypothetical protein ACRC68_07860 [Clostridium sp.]